MTRGMLAPPPASPRRWCGLVLLVAACSSGGRSSDGSSGGTGGSGRSDGGAGQDTSAAPDASEAPRFLCRLPPPPGAPVPHSPPLPVAGCPALVAGTNTVTSAGNARQFLLVLPAVAAQQGEQLPVLFMWHWLGASADSFLTKGEVQAAVDDQRFIAVIPVAKGATVIGTTFNTRWPFDVSQTAARMNEEFQFFDDMLACVAQQLPVDRNCVSTVGVSAGALFTDQLAQARSNVLASFISLSGGVGDTIIRPWSGAPRKLPGIVLWGGDGPPDMDGNRDILGCLGVGMDFSDASGELESALTADGHFFVECKHNCGHVEPPLEPPPGASKYAGLWEFALNHPFWLPAGASPYLQQGLPASLPAWCGIGTGGASPRTGGGCPPAENPCTY